MNNSPGPIRERPLAGNHRIVHCSECGNRTYKGFPVCAYCRRGAARPLRRCGDCGTTTNVRKWPSPDAFLRCRDCYDRWQIQRMFLVAPGIVEQKGTLSDIGEALQLSGERVRQILFRYPELRYLHRRAHRNERAGKQAAAAQLLQHDIRQDLAVTA